MNLCINQLRWNQQLQLHEITETDLTGEAIRRGAGRTKNWVVVRISNGDSRSFSLVDGKVWGHNTVLPWFIFPEALQEAIDWRGGR